MNKRHLIIPIFQPFEGCLNRCIFCNQRLLHPDNTNITEEEITKTIKKYLTTYKGKRENTDIEVALYGGTFTNINIQKQMYILNSLQKHILKKEIDGIRFSTRPDTIDKSMLNFYKNNGVTTIEIGAQTFNDDILKAIKRGHTAKDIRDSIETLKSYKFRTSIHLMFGLPQSNIEDDIHSIEETISLKPDYVRLHPTLVLKDTELEDLYKNGKYQPLSLNNTIKILQYAIKRFSESNINIIRVGLHNDENLVNPKTLVAGPFHPSLKQLVYINSN